METAEQSILRHINVMVRWHVDRATSWIRDHLPAMAESRTEGPPKDYEDVEDLRNLVRLAVRAGGQHYHEGGGEKRMFAWILTVLGMLFVSGVTGAFIGYGKLTAIEAKVETGYAQHERRIETLERANERRYRGSDASP
jgi:hypothetical protein